ncbi:hypothetical protein [Paenibacillus camerounensis]|uniref:hypothetical protein n=1 Tax=Paenibacillus camerounensis TaxID=1243663 RepID=UPI0005AA9DA5|nr:hypothetical protein [Paenibacillus camerounensis]
MIQAFSSAILMPTYLKDSHGVTMRQAAKMMKNFSYGEYTAKAIEIFDLLRSDNEGKWIKQLNRRARGRWKFQRIWSEKFPRSTAKEYALLIKSIFEGNRLHEDARPIFNDLIRLQVPDPQFAMAAQKGGSSLSIINLAMYYEDLSGSKTEMVLFVHDPPGGEQLWIEQKLVLFINQYFTNKLFRQLVKQSFHSKNG